MTRYVKKKKILLFCNPILTEAIINNIKNCYFEIGKTLIQIREYKPNTIIFDREVEGICKYSNKKTYLLFLSNDTVFSRTLEDGFDSKSQTNPDTEVGKRKVIEEELVKKHEKSLILRLSYILDNKDISKIIEDMKDNKKINNQNYLYPMLPVEVSKVLDTLISLEAKGIAHLRGSEKITFYKIACLLSEKLKLPLPQSYYAFGKTVNIKLNGIVLPINMREIIMKGTYDKSTP